MGLEFFDLNGLVDSFYRLVTGNEAIAWLVLIFIVRSLRSSNRKRFSDADRRKDLQQERHRIDMAERRAQEVAKTPASPDTMSLPDRRNQTAERPREPAATPSVPILPSRAVDPLPADLHPDPLADAPRANLRGGTGSTNVAPANPEAVVTESSDQAPDRPPAAAAATETAPDASVPTEEPAPKAPAGRSPRRASLSADGSST